MRYADGGVLSERGRATREQVRLRAAEWFAQDVPVGEIARRPGVSANAVYTWRRRWRVEGEAGLASKGLGGSSCRLDRRRLDRLAKRWSGVPPRTGSATVNADPWPGSPI
ncbi:helix-turn-helix domain-containing protein [Saccharothrix sp. BKS2]|uniref:helix-turn-helix domain-containing protein n=1 Tax=Saccharothrix sp. BKS2 TaxID=3064400 RepID=UPI0039EB3D5C